MLRRRWRCLLAGHYANTYTCRKLAADSDRPDIIWPIPPVRTVAGFFSLHVRRAKNLRNELVDGYFRSQGREEGRKLADELRQDTCNGLCITIAFNTPWVIDILTAAWRRYATGMILVVVDNSSDSKAREAIKRICEARSVPYLALPRNPERNPNRSHGIALNWAYYNLVRHVRPGIFGYIDHDCFPIAPVDIPARMEDRTVYGRRWQTHRLDGAWHLWAGLCFFRFTAVENLELDFKPRIEFGLDTGGGELASAL